MEECKHLLHPLQLKLQKNALRVEISTPVSRCALLPKKDQFGREYNVALYVLSGGDPIDCASMCVGRLSHRCPLPKKVKMLKTLDPICVPNGTIGELIETRENGLSMAKFGEYVVFVYPDEIKQVSEPNNHRPITEKQVSHQHNDKQDPPSFLVECEKCGSGHKRGWRCPNCCP